jgi:hypothetical protein
MKPLREEGWREIYLLRVDLPLNLDRVRSIHHAPARPDRRILEGSIEELGLDRLDMEGPVVQLGDQPGQIVFKVQL